jgi:crotonobetaine/carnitine-CoA ligase
MNAKIIKLPPQPKPMHLILEERIALDGDRILAIFDDRTLTYKDLDTDSRHMAAALQKQGVRKGDPVLIMLSNRSEILVLFFALAHLGAVAVPVNHALKGESLLHILQITKCRLIIIENVFLERVRECLGCWESFEKIIIVGSGDFDLSARHMTPYAELIAQDLQLQKVYVTGGDPWMILFTSGTTGVAKGVILPHQQISSAAWDAAHDLAMDVDSVFYTFHPQFHLNGIVFGPLAALMAGAKAVIRHDFPREHLLEDLKSSGATLWTATGFVLRGLLSGTPKPDDHDNNLRFILSYGATLEDIEAFETRFGGQLMTTYGATESGMVCKAQPARLGDAGSLSDRHEMRIVDTNGNDVPIGNVGEIWTRSHQSYDGMLGYYSMPEETKAAFSGDWFRTGDLGQLDNNNFLHFADRLKESLKRRGENISTYEVENALRSFPGVLGCAVLGFRNGPEAEEEVRAFLEIRGGTGTAFNFEDLARHCSKNLAYFMVPRFFDVMDELPKTALGKIEKHRLKDMPLTTSTFDLKTARLSLER